MKAVKPDLGRTSFRRSTQLSVLTSWLDCIFSVHVLFPNIFFNYLNP